MVTRHKTIPVQVGKIWIGGDYPIAIQSMTNTDTADVDKTVAQIIALHEAGSEIIRLTVDRDDAAKAIPIIYEKLLQKNINVPLVGDFHYIGHKLLTNYPICAEVLAKYRINPGNVGFKDKKDKQFSQMVEVALNNDKPIRIGVNWGSLDQELLTYMMDQNSQASVPRTSQEIIHESLVISALSSAERTQEMGLASDKIVISAKVSNVQDLIAVYQLLAKRSKYALHLGLTEAGMGIKGTVSSSAALAILLQQGIGDTIRVSLTPEPGGDRAKEVEVAKEILQSMGFRSFLPVVTACPGCGRTTSSVFQELACEIQDYIKLKSPQWRKEYTGFEELKLAVMGCIVNGPGESKHADIGISLPGTGEKPSAPVFIDGNKYTTLKGDNLTGQFKNIIEGYVSKRYKKI